MPTGWPSSCPGADMATIDLSTPPPAPSGLLDALPRRVGLTLPELRLAAERAGGAPLPFHLVDAARAGDLEDRLGGRRAAPPGRAVSRTGSRSAARRPRTRRTPRR